MKLREGVVVEIEAVDEVVVGILGVKALVWKGSFFGMR
jgi:hypothetical protein